MNFKINYYKIQQTYHTFPFKKTYHIRQFVIESLYI